MFLGEPDTIPIKVFRSQRQSTQSNDKPESSRHQGSDNTRWEDPTENILLSKEALDKVKDTVKRGKLLPQDAIHDELRAYTMLASDITKNKQRKQGWHNINYLPPNNPRIHGRRRRAKVTSARAKIQ